MRFTPTAIPEIVRVELLAHRDARGYFAETYHEAKFRAGGIDARFVQDNCAASARGVLRGLHAQRERPQGKLIRAVEGEIYDVAVDARVGSPSFGRWIGETLSAENFRLLWVPPGFLHGYCVLSERAVIEYKCTELYAPEDEYGVAYDDPELGIAWPVAAPNLSARDRALPRLAEAMAGLPRYRKAAVG